jgi:hypothetical protein
MCTVLLLCSVLFSAVQCCSVLFSAVQCCSVLFSAVQCWLYVQRYCCPACPSVGYARSLLGDVRHAWHDSPCAAPPPPCMWSKCMWVRHNRPVMVMSTMHGLLQRLSSRSLHRVYSWPPALLA